MTIPPKTRPPKEKAPIPRKTVKVPTKTVAAPVATAAPVAAAPPMLRKKELIDRVVLRSGIKKKDAKPVIEAMLSVLGEALAADEVLNLQPLGKVMVKRTKELPNAKLMVCRIRQRREGSPGSVVKIPTNR